MRNVGGSVHARGLPSQTARGEGPGPAVESDYDRRDTPRKPWT